jgi:2-polyprenyl-3-methyl-5-hydroxy-6-metoxy-1,4-benzoquinol methylase
MNSSSLTAEGSVNQGFSAADTGCVSPGVSNLSDFSNMNAVPADFKNHTVRLLVAIASFGEKNLGFLKRIIRSYQDMRMAVDVVVFSDKPKDLGHGVKVIVGLPSKNPWSLPFGHKAYFAQNVDRYDLFIYSEDDMEVTEKNIRAFLEVTPKLKPEEIAGFLRYEESESGDWSLPEVHGPFCWKPRSVKRRGNHTIAEFSNEHAALYLLTTNQLRRAIASGGFLSEPYEGRYDMLCCAATDPYTKCGLRKVICISKLEDFLIHHLPNRYVGQLGIPLASFKEQVQTLTDIGNGTHPVSNLCETESRLQRGKWSKSYYEKPRNEVLEMVPCDARTILSIGCGSGATETSLKQRGAKVTVFPLDSVIGAAGARLGLEVIYGTMEECFNRLGQRDFDCVLITDLLHLLPNPWQVLDQSWRFVGKAGTLVISGPNFHSLRILGKRALNIGDYRKLSSIAQSGVRTLTTGAIARQLASAGWDVVATRSFDYTPPRKMVNLRRRLGRLVADSWVLSTRRSRWVK